MEFVIPIVGVVALLAFAKFVLNHPASSMFDEDIKYLVFDEYDKDKMTPENFAKAMEVNRDQMDKRKADLAKK